MAATLVLVLLLALLGACDARVDGRDCAPCPDCPTRCRNETGAGKLLPGVNTAYPADLCELRTNGPVPKDILIAPSATACERRGKAVLLYRFTCPAGSTASM